MKFLGFEMKYSREETRERLEKMITSGSCAFIGCVNCPLRTKEKIGSGHTCLSVYFNKRSIRELVTEYKNQELKQVEFDV